MREQRSKQANKNLFWCLCVSISLYLGLFAFSVTAQEEPTEANKIKVANKFSYKLQKYTGFNFIIDFLAEGVIKTIVKLKTHADEVIVDLKPYSGWDLIRKKAKSLTIKANNLFVKDIPVEKFELTTRDPISLKKKRAVIPFGIDVILQIDINKITEVLNALPKWKKVFESLELPIPPFGTTQVEISNLNISISENAQILASALLKSRVNKASEPIKINFSGNLVLENKKLIVTALQSEIEDIFTKDSDTAKSFSEFLEDLINPVFDFHKYEKNGLTIEKVTLSFASNDLILQINSRLLPEQNE